MNTQTIWKFPLEVTGEQNVQMPEGATVLAVQCQHEQLCLWALVNPEAPKQRRVIEIIGTGQPIVGIERRYIGSAQMIGGSLVWHVFERE